MAVGASDTELVYVTSFDEIPDKSVWKTTGPDIEVSEF